MNNLLEVKELRKSFGSGASRVDVLKGINLAVEPGETIALVGASGAGKSTLLHIMGALDRPTTGEILFKGKDIFQLSDASLASFRNHSVGFVFQFHHLLPEFSALENAMMPAIISGMNRGEAEALAVELLTDVGLGHRLSHKPGELSGGEQQRVAIARALIQSPPLLLADEPTGNLDTRTSEEVHSLLSEIHEKKGITLVIVTHNENLASRMGKIIRLVDGNIQ
ncbi:MAG TPA: ABC transporter ATP-binding protein [Geobacteraceae bacterium]|nr:ABC transporter ATP-binding protein [Geobacteraceae bacterium]